MLDTQSCLPLTQEKLRRRNLEKKNIDKCVEYSFEHSFDRCFSASFSVDPNMKNLVKHLVSCGVGVWVSVWRKATIKLYHAETYDMMQEVNIVSPILKMKKR